MIRRLEIVTEIPTVVKKKIFVLDYSFNDSTFSVSVFHKIKSLFSEVFYTFEKTELHNSEFRSFGVRADSNVIAREFSKLKHCDFLILIFPYSIMGLPSIVKDWFDKVLYKKDMSNFNHKKGLVVTYTPYPRESFKPNSFHQSTIKRRLHYLLYGIFKSCSIQPLEPLVFYNYSQLNSDLSSFSSNTGSIHMRNNSRSDIDELSRVLTSKLANAEVIENDSNNSNINVNSIRTQSVSKNKKERSNKGAQEREEFLSELTSSLMCIEEANEIDIVEL